MQEVNCEFLELPPPQKTGENIRNSGLKVIWNSEVVGRAAKRVLASTQTLSGNTLVIK